MRAVVHCLLLAAAAAAASNKVKLLHQWRSVDYEFPSQSARDSAIRSGAFVPGNPIPIDVDVWQQGGATKMFLTLPRFLNGNPASLVTVSNRNEGESPLLTPYPDWSWHTEGQCSGITSAFRSQIDKCGRLWVIDSGMVDLFKYPRRRLCQPQVLAFSLATDKLAGKHQFPSSILTEGSVLATIAVDVRDAQESCKDTFTYVADVTGFAILVFDARRGKSWRVQSNTMFPYPPHGVFNTNGVTFDLLDGVLGLALTPLQRGGDRMLYYHAFASTRESWVPTSVLRNESLYTTGFNTAPRRFKMSDEARASQAAPEVFDKNGNLYFGIISRNSIACWNLNKPYSSKNIHELVKDDANLQFNTGIKIHETEDGQEDLYMLTDRFQLAMVGQMNPKEVNFRILKARISDLTQGSGCRGGQNGQQSPSRPIAFPQPRPNGGSGHGYGSFG